MRRWLPLVVVVALLVGAVGRAAPAVERTPDATCVIGATGARADVLGIAESHRPQAGCRLRAVPWLLRVPPPRVAPSARPTGRRLEGRWPAVPRRRPRDVARRDDADPLS